MAEGMNHKRCIVVLVVLIAIVLFGLTSLFWGG